MATYAQTKRYITFVPSVSWKFVCEMPGREDLPGKFTANASFIEICTPIMLTEVEDLRD